ncbi:hypothetical protein B0H16DRAFT_1714656 [Mycena metata]|uniref:Uncharacterized protein n=1 Tax=Mycena metata TaxID=1033252 RepID=A0AAD7NRF4_9AGAR|nr:hypothetical protein B0H16DRAFT_1714656 [Mycena metata]
MASVKASYDDFLSTNLRLQKVNDAILSQNRRLQHENDCLHGELKELRQASLQMANSVVSRDEKAVADAVIVETHEVLDRALQGFNDIIFDTKRTPGPRGVLTAQQKGLLKGADLRYSTSFVRSSSAFKITFGHLAVTHFFTVNAAGLPEDVMKARACALGILAPAERDLCRALVTKLMAGRVERNRTQHPPPDKNTALYITSKFLSPSAHATLAYFLATDPCRMRLESDPFDTDRRIFAADGTYRGAQMKQCALEELKLMQAIMEARLVAKSR